MKFLSFQFAVTFEAHGEGELSAIIAIRDVMRGGISDDDTKALVRDIVAEAEHAITRFVGGDVVGRVVAENENGVNVPKNVNLN
jgi:hypothetical protein